MSKRYRGLIVNGAYTRVYPRGGAGGDFEFPRDDGRYIRVCIGMDQPWAHVVATLVHEFFELRAALLGLRVANRDELAFDAAGVRFYFDHAQYTELCVGVGHDLADVLPWVAGVHTEWQEKKEKDDE